MIEVPKIILSGFCLNVINFESLLKSIEKNYQRVFNITSVRLHRNINLCSHDLQIICITIK